MAYAKLAAAVVLWSFTSLAQAHYFWIERDGSDGRAYFGEWISDERENRDGYLKDMQSPRAFLADGKDLVTENAANHVLIKDAGKGDLRFVEEAVFGKSLAVFHARSGRTETRAVLDLELVPTAAGANSFTLLFRGAPVADTDVTVFSPSGWQRNFKTDAQGKVAVETPWQGFYVVEASHTEAKGGSLGDKAYEKTRHVSTVSFDSKGVR